MPVSLNKSIAFLAATIVAAVAASAQAQETRIGGVPFPSDAVEGDVASPFAGTWFGSWGGRWRTIMMVERMHGADVEAVYAVGPQGDYQGGWRRIQGNASADGLTLNGPTYSLDFELRPSGRLRARYNNDQGFAIMVRGDLEANHPWSFGASEMIETDLFEGGAPVRLETVIYKPDGEGPFPLAVINHGSTGAGDDPSLFKQTFRQDWLADILVERGWIVAFPQRRGRGGSEGLYDEGFAKDRSSYTCDAEPSLKGADRALEDISAIVRALRQRPDVSNDPVLIGGNSRGGVLSVAWAGENPDQTHGVLNFVGGWLGEGCGDSAAVNRALFARGGAYRREMLWLYGADDRFYSLDFSRKNLDAFRIAGGSSEFREFEVNGDNNGHWLIFAPSLWQDAVLTYLNRL